MTPPAPDRHNGGHARVMLSERLRNPLVIDSEGSKRHGSDSSIRPFEEANAIADCDTERALIILGHNGFPPTRTESHGALFIPVPQYRSADISSLLGGLVALNRGVGL